MSDETESTEAAEPVVSPETTAEASGSEETSVAAAESSEQTTEEPEAVAADEQAAAGEDEAGPVAEEKPVRAAPITSTPRRQRLADERAARKAAAGPNPSQSAEERQAKREELRRRKAKVRTHNRAKTREAYKASEHERRPTPPREHEVGNKKVRQGIVVSDKADKTITVRIDAARRHRRYGKVVRTSSTFHAHDESNDAKLGDTVVIQESRPLSATKRWRLVEVVERAR